MLDERSRERGVARGMTLTSKMLKDALIATFARAVTEIIKKVHALSMYATCIYLHLPSPSSLSQSLAHPDSEHINIDTS